MSANTLNNRSIGQTILDTFFNDIHTALDGDFVGRGATGIPTSGQNLGTLAVPWGTLFAAQLNLGGSALDVSKIVSPANRVISGKTRTTSNQPAFITPNGSAASLLVAAATTNLSLSIAGVAVLVNTDITKGSLTTAPATQNTATINDSTAIAQAATRTWGEVGAPNKITMASPGTNISNLIGKFATFKHGSEYFIALVESSTLLSHALRGYFYDSSLNPINAGTLTNGDTLTLMKTGFVYMTNDATTVDVSYTFPVYASSAPVSPATGDYWYDTVNNIWKRYDGVSWDVINRTLIGIVVMDSSNCVAARSIDFYAAPSSENTLDLEIAATATNIQAKRLLQSTVVNGKSLGFGHYLPVWNGTNNYAASADTYTTFSTNSTYYLYMKDDGTTVVSDISPYFRPDLFGYYNRHNPWRCVAIATTDGSSNWLFCGTLQKAPPNGKTRTTLLSTGTAVGYLFTVSSANATIGATFTNNTQTFTVLATIASGTQLFCLATGAPASSGTLTKATGTGDSTITFSVAYALAQYNPPTNAVGFTIRGWGGGGGGGSSNSGAGVAGTPTAFIGGYGASPLIANGGAAGTTGNSGPNAGGTASVGTNSGIAIQGGNGGSTGNVANENGGMGAAGPFGGAGGGGASSTAGGAATTNSGAGGGGGGGQSGVLGGEGGAAGGYFDAHLGALTVGYYVIGAKGTGGTGGNAGGNGGEGGMIIDEEY